MALMQIVPAQVGVACDPFTGRPREIRMAGGRMKVMAIERVREETAAYPADVGPRTLFVVRTGDWRMRLAFHHRGRRWLVEALDPRPATLGAAA